MLKIIDFGSLWGDLQMSNYIVCEKVGKSIDL